jgi:hypothetical protein
MPEFIPLYSAGLSAIVALIVAWVASTRTVRLEVDKLRLSTQQLAFSKLLEVRIREYPSLYAMLSDLPKALEEPSTVEVELGRLLRKVNEWDSKYAIYLGPETSNTCYSFRQALRNAVNLVADDRMKITEDLLGAAARLELALRSDLGIHGFGVAGADLAPREREYY